MPSTSTRVVLHVDPRTARAYRDAPPDIRTRAESAFALALQARQETADEALRFFDAVAQSAQDRGLTPQILDDILDDRPAGLEEQGEPSTAE